MIFPANLLTGAKYSSFSINHLADNDETKQNYNDEQHKNLNNQAKIYQH